jgi:hypothetical protein
MTVIKSTWQVFFILRLSTIQCNRAIECGDEHCSENKGYNAFTITPVRVANDTVRWLNLQCKCTIQCDDQTHSVSEVLNAVNKTHSASENQSAVIINPVRVTNERVQWSTIHCKWAIKGVNKIPVLVTYDAVRWPKLQCESRKIHCGDQHYSASERYSKIINTTAQVKSTMRWWTYSTSVVTVRWTTSQFVRRKIKYGNQQYTVECDD